MQGALIQAVPLALKLLLRLPQLCRRASSMDEQPVFECIQRFSCHRLAGGVKGGVAGQPRLQVFQGGGLRHCRRCMSPLLECGVLPARHPGRRRLAGPPSSAGARLAALHWLEAAAASSDSRQLCLCTQPSGAAALSAGRRLEPLSRRLQEPRVLLIVWDRRMGDSKVQEAGRAKHLAPQAAPRRMGGGAGAPTLLPARTCR